MSPSPKDKIKKVDETPTEVNTTPTTIYVEKAVTKNMGDYNSAKVTVGINIPVNPPKSLLEDIDKAITVAIEIVDKRLEEEVDKLSEED